MRVIDSNNDQLGILTKPEALVKAREQQLDLIEVAPNAEPPVARILDYKKFRYEESKKERASKKGSNEGGLKELWFSPRIAEHDMLVRLRRIEQFLQDGNKVKLTVKFKGREMAHPENGHDVLKQVLTYLGDKVAVERAPKFEGRKLTLIVTKSKGGNKTENKNAETKN